MQGINKMINEGDKPCDVILQIKASKQALRSFMTLYMQENFCECMKTCKTKKERAVLIKKMLNNLSD